MSAAALGAQSKPADSDKATDADKNAAASAGIVTFTGCLSPQSSKPDSFYLTSAKQKGVKGAAQTLKIVPATKKVDLDAFVTKEVEVSGTLDQAGPAAAAGGSDKTPTLTVTKVKIRADGC
jgi:hypothetical protein